jgi:hypothetical protein
MVVVVVILVMIPIVMVIAIVVVIIVIVPMKAPAPVGSEGQQGQQQHVDRSRARFGHAPNIDTGGAEGKVPAVSWPTVCRASGRFGARRRRCLACAQRISTAKE